MPPSCFGVQRAAAVGIGESVPQACHRVGHRKTSTRELAKRLIGLLIWRELKLLDGSPVKPLQVPIIDVLHAALVQDMEANRLKKGAR